MKEMSKHVLCVMERAIRPWIQTQGTHGEGECKTVNMMFPRVKKMPGRKWRKTEEGEIGMEKRERGRDN